jgi:hypothetical protein
MKKKAIAIATTTVVAVLLIGCGNTTSINVMGNNKNFGGCTAEPKGCLCKYKDREFILKKGEAASFYNDAEVLEVLISCE